MCHIHVHEESKYPKSRMTAYEEFLLRQNDKKLKKNGKGSSKTLWRTKIGREEKGVGGVEERGGEQERYALLEDWERKTTGRSEREGSRESKRS